MQKQKEAKTFKKDFYLIFSPRFCDLQNLKKIVIASERPRAWQSALFFSIGGWLLQATALANPCGLPQLCFAKFRKDEIFPPDSAP